MKQKQENILFLSRLYYPHIGGVEKHVNKVTRELLLKKKRVTVVTELHDTRLKEKEQFESHVIYRIPIGKSEFLKKFYVWFWFAKNISLISNADIIHAHDVFYWLLPFRIFFPFKKIYVTFHGYEDYPIKKRWIIQRKLTERLTNGSICIGSFMKKWYQAKPNLIVYGGADFPTNATQPQIASKALFFGRLERQTGAYEYAVAAKKIKNDLRTFKFTMVGEGPLQKKLTKYGKVLPFDPNIEKKIPDYRYIFVSRYLSMLEVLVQKRLIFAYIDTPIKKDYLLDSPFGKFIVTAESVEELRQKFMYYYAHPGKERKMIDQGYKWAKEQTWENVANNYLRLWKTKR